MDVPFSAMTTSTFIRHECSISDQFYSSGKYKSYEGPSRSLSTSFHLVNSARAINHFLVHFGAYKTLSSASRTTDYISIQLIELNLTAAGSMEHSLTPNISWRQIKIMDPYICSCKCACKCLSAWFAGLNMKAPWWHRSLVTNSPALYHEAGCT